MLKYQAEFDFVLKKLCLTLEHLQECQKTLPKIDFGYKAEKHPSNSGPIACPIFPRGLKQRSTVPDIGQRWFAPNPEILRRRLPFFASRAFSLPVAPFFCQSSLRRTPSQLPGRVGLPAPPPLRPACRAPTSAAGSLASTAQAPVCQPTLDPLCPRR